MARFPSSSKGGGKGLGFPDVCKVPAPPAPFVPVPYPTEHVSKLDKAVEKVKVKQSEVVGNKIPTSAGNEAGSMKEIVSLNTAGPAFKAFAGALTVIAELLVSHKNTIRRAPQYKYDRAKQIQDKFERALQTQLKILNEAARTDRSLLPTANEVTKVVSLAAKGE